MVLESIIPTREMLKHPLFMLFLAALAGSVSLWVAYFTFPGSASVLAIAFATIALVPLMHHIFRREEEREAEKPGYAALFVARHFSVVKVYAFLFIGLILTYAFWYTILPPPIRGTFFAEQDKALDKISGMRQVLTGNFSGVPAACGTNPFCWFDVIFFNNAFVLLLAVAFSFIYSAGVVFLIGWNASVIGVLIGRDVVQMNAGGGNLPASFGMGLYNAIGILPYGLFESLGYFLGAISGGIIGAAISRKKHVKGEFGTILKDSSVMLVYAMCCLALGAIIEAYAIVYSL
jgi:hypothetical protein